VSTIGIFEGQKRRIRFGFRNSTLVWSVNNRFQEFKWDGRMTVAEKSIKTFHNDKDDA
jgi:hypothetical protein